MTSKATRLLLISPDGMLGRAVDELLARRGASFGSVRYPDLDLTQLPSIERHVAPGLEVVVNCSAWTDVDGAEAREAVADAVNATGVGLLAARCRDVGATLVHFSTDYVFDGAGSRPYGTSEARAPVNAYGRTKARGEELLEASGCRFLLVRTSWLYAPWGTSFVRTIARLARSREELRVVDDQRGRPTSAEHLAETTLALLDADAEGTFHVTDGGECTWYELAGHVAGLVAPACRVLPCSSAEFPRPARRPAYSVLDIAGTERLLGRAMPHWIEAVSGVVRRLPPD